MIFRREARRYREGEPHRGSVLARPAFDPEGGKAAGLMHPAGRACAE